MKHNLDEYKSQILEFGKIFLDAYDETSQLSLGNKNIIICGMGGSGITANYIGALAAHFRSTIQIAICKDYILPPFVSDNWLALVISYSGNTEETIAMTAELLNKGIETQIMTSGGQLMEIAKNGNIPLHKLTKGFQPRFALPMILGKAIKLFTPILGFEIITTTQRNEILNFQNLENQQTLLNIINACKSKKIVLLSDTLFSPVALRFRCQLNENSKLIVQTYILPEFNHNAIVGIEAINENEYIFFFISNELYEHDRTRIQRKFVQSFLKDKRIEVINIKADYTDLLLHFLSITRKLDFLSFLIAQDMGTDPMKVESISQLKLKLQKI